jgi:hypothetical protein
MKGSVTPTGPPPLHMFDVIKSVFAGLYGNSIVSMKRKASIIKQSDGSRAQGDRDTILSIINSVLPANSELLCILHIRTHLYKYRPYLLPSTIPSPDHICTFFSSIPTLEAVPEVWVLQVRQILDISSIAELRHVRLTSKACSLLFATVPSLIL